MIARIGGACTKAARAAWRATVTRPVGTVYILASVMLALSFQNPVYIVGCIVVLGCAAILAVTLAVRRELEIVHQLVNSQHDELVNRVEQLTEALETSGIPVPEPVPLRHYGGTR